MDCFDILAGVIAQKRKQIDHIAIENSRGSKMIKHADLFKKEKEAYLEKQKQLENEQKLALTSKSVDQLNDDKMTANAVDTMPRSEVIKKLRIRGLPIRLFAETDEEALKRLRIELEKPEFNVGLKNDFQAALLQVENEEVMEKIAKGSTDTNEVDKLNIVIEESEEDATWEQIQKGASSLGSGEHNKDCDLIFAFISYILKRWAKELNARPEMIKRSPAGKVQAGMQKQTVEHMNPLLRSLEKHSVNFDIRAHLTNITRFCVLDRDYVQANNAYMEMAIGNSPWPVGVTRSGIHQRPGSSKAYASNVAHVMNDETQRKYIHGLKRVLTKCQDFFPADPNEDSWTVDRFQSELLNAEKTGKFTCEDLEPLWEKAKSAIQNEEEAVSLYTTFIYLTLRMLKKQGIVDFTKVEQLFEEASCFIDECFEQYSESSIQLEKNYANFLYTKMGKVEKAREIWARLLDGETGPFSWLEAISLERNYGNIENARRLFYKALDNVSFRPHIIYSAFVQFEREEGNRSDLDNALERVNLLASKIREEDIQQQKRKRKQDGKQQQNEREKGNFKRAAKVPKVERKGGKDINSKETSLPQKTKQGKLDLLKNEEQMDIDNTNLIENSITKTTTFETCNVPIGPIIPQINNQNNEKINNTKKEVVKEDLQQQQSSAFPYSTSLEKNKLFVKHLHFGCKEDELKDLFSKFGNVLDVRIITKWNGRSKGCAYVDFEKDSEASAAVLGANGALIRGKQIEVYLSNPSIKKREKPMEEAVKPSTSSDKNEGNISTKKEHKKPQNSLNFIPRAAQRIGKASRLDLSTNISKKFE